MHIWITFGLKDLVDAASLVRLPLITVLASRIWRGLTTLLTSAIIGHFSHRKFVIVISCCEVSKVELVVFGIFGKSIYIFDALRHRVVLWLGKISNAQVLDVLASVA